MDINKRKTYIGASEQSDVQNIEPWGCRRKLAYSKLEDTYPRDYDSSDRPEFRRGHRLEQVAADYYVEKTGRKVFKPETFFGDKSHLAANLDRVVHHSTKEISAKHFGKPGYLELKTLGRESFINVKRNGLYQGYILQLHYGMKIAGFEWGSFGVYSPELDELLHWDHEIDHALADKLIEDSDDFYLFHVATGVLPEPLPDGAKPCAGCDWRVTCKGEVSIPESSKDVVARPDLESLVAKYAEMNGIGKEAEEAKDGLKEEIMEAIKATPGKYLCGKYSVDFRVQSANRFDSTQFKKLHQELYDKFCKVSVTKILKVGE